jgi:predicted RNA methylase
VTLVDIDPDAIEIAQENIENLELKDHIQIINMDVNDIADKFYKKFDIVLTNPPFGIRSKKSADVGFLKKAINV